MPWFQNQSLTSVGVENTRVARQRFGPHLDPMRSSMRVWTLKGPPFERHGCGLDLGPHAATPGPRARARSKPPCELLVQDEERGRLILRNSRCLHVVLSAVATTVLTTAQCGRMPKTTPAAR